MKLIKFYATWCAPCKELDKVMERYKPSLEKNNITYTNLDIEQNEQLARQMGVRGVPTMFLIDDEDNNRIVKTHVGMINESGLDAFILKGNH